MSNEHFIPNEVMRRKHNQRCHKDQEKSRIATALGVSRQETPQEGKLLAGRFPEPAVPQHESRNRQKLPNRYADSDELLIAAKALASWFYSSDFPAEEKLALRNNVLREIAALNRYVAEIQQIGADTKIDSAPPYTEWFKMQDALEELEKMRKKKQERKR